MFLHVHLRTALRRARRDADYDTADAIDAVLNSPELESQVYAHVAAQRAADATASAHPIMDWLIAILPGILDFIFKLLGIPVPPIPPLPPLPTPTPAAA